MKNKGKQSGSQSRWLCAAVLIAAIMFNVLMITGCPGDLTDEPPPPPPPPPIENNYGWNVWRDNSSSATMTYSVAEDGVCTVTVGGTPHQHSDGVWEAWKVSAEYNYTGVAGKAYEFKFEAWTQSDVRDLHVQYYNDNNDQVYLGETFPITNTRTTYTIYGEPLPKSGNRPLSFQVADQTGTVYLKVLEIKELVKQ